MTGSPWAQILLHSALSVFARHRLREGGDPGLLNEMQVALSRMLQPSLGKSSSLH
jgi:hypothetical protein